MLHLDRITRCARIEDVYACLDTFLPGLESFYDEAWDRVSRGNDLITSRRARLILMWVTLAEESLSVRALREATSASVHGVKGSLLTEQEIIGSCAGLLHSVVDRISRPPLLQGLGLNQSRLTDEPENRCITFVHASAHQYFLNKASFYFPYAHDSIAATCLSFSDPVVVTWAMRFQASFIAIILYTMPEIFCLIYKSN